MKSTPKFLIALCLAAAMSAVSAAAYAEDTFLELPLEHTGEGFTTVLTDTEGDIHTLDGVPDVEAAEALPYVEGITSYQIRYDGEVLLETALHDVHSQVNTLSDDFVQLGGYYAVTFTVSKEAHTKAFLTGLTPENLTQVQTELVNARLENSEFIMEQLRSGWGLNVTLGWVDANGTRSGGC